MEQLRIDYFSRFLEQHAAREVIRFLRPRGTLEKYYNISVILFPIVSYFSQEQIIYRALMLIIILFFYFASYVHPHLVKKEKITFPNPAVHSWKFFISWIATITITAPFSLLNEPLIPILNLSYANIEQWIACSFVLLGTWMNRVRLPLLKINKWAWFSSVLKGFWYQSLLFLLLWIYGIFPKVIGIFVIPSIIIDMVLVAGIASNLLSYVVLQKSLNIDQLPKIAAIDPSIVFQKSFLIEIRDAGFITAIFILLVMIAWDPFIAKDFWLFLGISSFVAGSMLFITVIPELSGDVSQLLMKDADNFECILDNDEWKKIAAISNNLEEISEQLPDVSPPNVIYTLKKKHQPLELFDFMSFQLIARPKMIIPLQETKEGVVTVLIGEFQLKRNDTNQLPTTRLDLEEMVVQPPELSISKEIAIKISIKKDNWKKRGYMIVVIDWNKWNQVKPHLSKFTTRRKKIISEVLEMTNVESWQDLQSQIIENVLLFTRWNGPLGLFRLTRPNHESRNVQRTILPGIHLVRSPHFALLNVLGIIKGLIIPRGISYYRMPLLTIIDRPNEYFFLDSPVISLLDTDRGEASKLFGLSLKSGVLSALSENDVIMLTCKASNQAESFLEGVKKIFNGETLQFFFLQLDDGMRYAMIMSTTGMLAEVFRPHFYIRKSRILRQLSTIKEEEIKHDLQEQKEPMKDGRMDLEAAQLLLLHIPQCAICHRPVRKSTVICPFCGEEFCREEWLYYVFKNEQCPNCENEIQVPEKYRKMLENME